jgi:hypothetical protein
MALRERDILEHAVRTIAEQAAKARKSSTSFSATPRCGWIASSAGDCHPECHPARVRVRQHSL